MLYLFPNHGHDAFDHIHDMFLRVLQKFRPCWTTRAESGLCVHGDNQILRVPRCRNTRKYRTTNPLLAVHIGFDKKSRCHRVWE